MPITEPADAGFLHSQEHVLSDPRIEDLGVERRKAVTPEIEEIKRRLDAGDDRMSRIEVQLKKVREELSANSEATNANHELLREALGGIETLLDVQSEVKKAGQFLCRLSIAATWLMRTIKEYWIVATGIFAGAYFLIYGHLPDWLFKFIRLAFA